MVHVRQGLLRHGRRGYGLDLLRAVPRPLPVRLVHGGQEGCSAQEQQHDLLPAQAH